MLTDLPCHQGGCRPGRRSRSGCAPDDALQAGSRPGGRLTFLASPRKVSKERRAHVRTASRYLALLVSRGVGLNSLRSNNARPDPLAAVLLSPASMGDDQTSGETVTCRSASSDFSDCGLNAVMRRRVAQAAADQGRACLRRSRVCAHPAEAEQRSVPAGPTNPARLLFAYFLLAKQEKVSRPPGRDPARRALSGAQPDIPLAEARLGLLAPWPPNPTPTSC